MNRILLSALFALALATGAHAAVAVGAPAPDFSLMSDSGKTVQLSDYRGKLVVLEWVNSGCPFVHKQYDSDNMQRLQRKYTDEGVVWLTISSSGQGKEGFFADPKEARAFIKERNAAMTALLLDHKGVVGREYGAKTTPDMVVLTRKGTVAYEGAIDDKPSTDPADIPGAHNYVAAALDALMDGRPVAVTQTRSYGCSIKYE